MKWLKTKDNSIISTKKRQQCGRGEDGSGIPLVSTVRKQGSQVYQWGVSTGNLGERQPGPGVCKPGLMGQIQPYCCMAHELRIIFMFLVVEKNEKNNIL